MRVLIVRIGAMGDILHALPAVTALRAALPQAHIGWAVEPHWAPLLSPALVDTLHHVPTRDWKQKPFSLRTLRQILSLRKDLHAQQYDVAVDLQGSIRSAVIGRLAGALRFHGPAQPREPQARYLYTTSSPITPVNVIDQAFALLTSATRADLWPASTTLPLDPEAEQACEQELARLKVEPGFILISTAAGWGAKQWRVECYNSLILRLEFSGHRVVLNAGSGPGRLADSVAQDTQAVCISTSIAGLIALTRRAALVIGGDTGPIHLAAALGRPTLALFGPTDPARNGPNFPGANVKVLRHPSSVLSHKRTPITESGLAQITVEEVLKAALELLARGESQLA